MAAWFLVFAAFVFFLPYNRKTGRKPTNMYIAFIVASALEMFGIPLSMYFVAWALGIQLPAGLLWGHTLQQSIGYWGMYIGFGLNIVGGSLIYFGWKAVYKRYWKSETGEGELVTDGVYAYIRHPQYTGFILMTLGLLVHWATIPLLVMWPLLVVQYYRLARREEAEMVAEFGEEYSSYMEKTPMFFPTLSGRLGGRTRKMKMVTERAHEGRPVFLCGVCGFGYEDRETAEECEDFCSTYSSCSIKITAKAVYIPEESKIKELE